MDEAHHDFYGFPSNPLSIYHTGPAWPLPTGPDARGIPKEARPVCVHKIAPVWRQLGEKIYKYFDSVELKWTSIDPVRFAEAGKEPGPLFLWVGVVPRTLTLDEAKAAAVRCKEILAEYGFIDIEIAFRGSFFMRTAGSKALTHVPSVDPTADVCRPFSSTLGLQIAPKTFPFIESTGCLYICEGSGDNRVFLLTTRHGLLPPGEYANDTYHRTNLKAPRRDVMHLGTRAYQIALDAVVAKLKDETAKVDQYKKEIEGLGEATENDDPGVTKARKALAVELAKAESTKARVNELHDDVTKHWGTENQRILGHILYTPPLAIIKDSLFTEDWSLIELIREKFEWDGFLGNVIDLGTKYTADEYMKKMYPHAETRAKFEYPPGGLMHFKDYVKVDEMQNPTTVDENGEECLIVVKNGTNTGVTLGRSTGIVSFLRDYNEYGGIRDTSVEIPVYAYSHKDGAFSNCGDSGSVICDGKGRIFGMLTGCTGQNDITDITYVTPFYFMNDRIKKAFPNSYFYSVA